MSIQGKGRTPTPLEKTLKKLKKVLDFLLKMMYNKYTR
jgi:DNA-binding protein H-NS